MKYIVKWITYTQFCGMDYYGEDDSLEFDEEIEEEYENEEEARKEAKKNKYGHRGQLVEVYINGSLEREYEKWN